MNSSAWNFWESRASTGTTSDSIPPCDDFKVVAIVTPPQLVFTPLARNDYAKLNVKFVKFEDVLKTGITHAVKHILCNKKNVLNDREKEKWVANMKRKAAKLKNSSRNSRSSSSSPAKRQRRSTSSSPAWCGGGDDDAGWFADAEREHGNRFGTRLGGNWHDVDGGVYECRKAAQEFLKPSSSKVFHFVTEGQMDDVYVDHIDQGAYNMYSRDSNDLGNAHQRNDNDPGNAHQRDDNDPGNAHQRDYNTNVAPPPEWFHVGNNHSFLVVDDLVNIIQRARNKHSPGQTPPPFDRRNGCHHHYLNAEADMDFATFPTFPQDHVQCCVVLGMVHRYNSPTSNRRTPLALICLVPLGPNRGIRLAFVRPSTPQRNAKSKKRPSNRTKKNANLLKNYRNKANDSLHIQVGNLQVDLFKDLVYKVKDDSSNADPIMWNTYIQSDTKLWEDKVMRPWNEAMGKHKAANGPTTRQHNLQTVRPAVMNRGDLKTLTVDQPYWEAMGCAGVVTKNHTAGCRADRAKIDHTDAKTYDEQRTQDFYQPQRTVARDDFLQRTLGGNATPIPSKQLAEAIKALKEAYCGDRKLFRAAVCLLLMDASWKITRQDNLKFKPSIARIDFDFVAAEFKLDGNKFRTMATTDLEFMNQRADVLKQRLLGDTDNDIKCSARLGQSKFSKEQIMKKGKWRTILKQSGQTRNKPKEIISLSREDSGPPYYVSIGTNNIDERRALAQTVIEMSFKVYDYLQKVG
jgi:hypothetical protein